VSPEFFFHSDIIRRNSRAESDLSFFICIIPKQVYTSVEFGLIALGTVHEKAGSIKGDVKKKHFSSLLRGAVFSGSQPLGMTVHSVPQRCWPTGSFDSGCIGSALFLAVSKRLQAACWQSAYHGSI
jgi:hypothetical protein